MAKLDLRETEVQGLEFISEYAKAIGAAWHAAPLYRGHAAHTWTPTAFAFRPGVAGIEVKADLKEWKAMAQRFVSPQPASDLGYLVLAQHYGIPTSLLDWTSNPLVALFFACQQFEKDVDGEVIQTTRSLFHPIEKLDSVGIFKKTRSQPLLIDTSAMNVRSTAQDSFMTMHTRKEKPLDVQVVFRIPGVAKHAVLAALCIFGLTPERVYVDLERAARRFQDSLDFERLLGEALG